MQDLVGIRIADAAEQRRIGERALDRMVLAGQRRREGVARGAERLEAAGIVQRQRALAVQQMERGASLGACLGQHQAALGEVERGEPEAADEHRARRPPVQPAGDHQMEHDEQLVVEADDDALAEARQPAHGPATKGGDRRVDGAQHEGVSEPDILQRPTRQAALQRLDIGGDVGQFGHGARLWHGGRAPLKSAPAQASSINPATNA